MRVKFVEYEWPVGPSMFIMSSLLCLKSKMVFALESGVKPNFFARME